MAEEANVYSMMQTGTPYKSYRKVVLGKIYVTTWDSFQNKPIGMIIEGDPSGKDADACIVDVWDEREDVFFKRANRRQFETGYLVDYVRPITTPPKSPNDFTDDELVTLIGKNFLGLKAVVNKMTSVAPVYRLLIVAKDLEKSEKIIKFLEGRISELQAEEYGIAEQETPQEA